MPYFVILTHNSNGIQIEKERKEENRFVRVDWDKNDLIYNIIDEILLDCRVPTSSTWAGVSTPGRSP